MKKELITAAIILLILCSATTIQQAYPYTVQPTKLKIYIGPTSALADNSTYKCIFVQLQDSSGKPTRATDDTAISLSSSLTNIGTVDPSITILKGQTYASANFHSTFSPGTTTIAATATGFTTVQATVTTIGPIPSAVAVYGFPSTLPADGNQYTAIMVQLQDSSGSPAKAPKDGVQVTLSCSNTTIGEVTSNVVIPEGKTYTTANFTTKTAAQIEGRLLSTVVTALAQGYTSKQVTITTSPLISNPTMLKIFTGPSQFLADQSSYKQIAVELQNATGFVGKVLSDVDATIASSDQSIGTVDPQILIPQSQSFALATLKTTYKAGVTTISAVATDLQRGQLSLTTVGFTPTKLAIYCAPSTMPSDNLTYPAIQVQLQDSQGRPAKDPQTDVTVSLFSSQPTVGTVSSTLTIPFGSTQATGYITVTNSQGPTIITAQASSYTTGQATLTTYLIDLSPTIVTVTVDPDTVNNGGKSQVTTYVTADDAPITGATTQFTSNNGGVFTAVTDLGNGYYKANFTAPSFTKTTNCTVTASVSKTGYVTSQASIYVTVQPPPSPTPTPIPTPRATPIPAATATPRPSPNTKSASTTNSTGLLKLRITDNIGNPLNDTSIASTVQPAGMRTLSGVTNETGYAVFTNATAGAYTFSILTEGNPQINQTINYKGQPSTFNIIVSGKTASASSSGSGLTIVVVILMVAIVVVIGGILAVKRREKTKKSNFKSQMSLSNSTIGNDNETFLPIQGLFHDQAFL